MHEALVVAGWRIFQLYPQPGKGLKNGVGDGGGLKYAKLDLAL
jgi:hypothetical protein